MNHSIYSADRTTHLKIVTVALIAGIAITGFGISMRSHDSINSVQTAHAIKADKPVMWTSTNAAVVH
jgi:hypothetical protein